MNQESKSKVTSFLALFLIVGIGTESPSGGLNRTGYRSGTKLSSLCQLDFFVSKAIPNEMGTVRCRSFKQILKDPPIFFAIQLYMLDVLDLYRSEQTNQRMK